MNASSLLASKRNSLDAKTKHFKANYAESEHRIQSQSSLDNLARSTYSFRNNQSFSPIKTATRINSSKRLGLNVNDPEAGGTIKGLNMRANHVSNFSDLNTELLLEKRNLENRIRDYKEEIAKEGRLKAKAMESSSKLHNMIDHVTALFEDASLRSKRLQECISDNRQQNQNLRNQINNLRHHNSVKSKNINLECQMIDQLENQVRVLKANLLQEDKNKTNLKAELLKLQRVMNSFSVEVKELQNQRAVVLLEINKSVQLNKL